MSRVDMVDACLVVDAVLRFCSVLGESLQVGARRSTSSCSKLDRCPVRVKAGSRTGAEIRDSPGKGPHVFNPRSRLLSKIHPSLPPQHLDDPRPDLASAARSKMAHHFRPLTPLDPRDFEPRSATPVNGRLSPEKVPIVSGFGGGTSAPRFSSSSSQHGGADRGKKGSGLFGGGGRAPFTPIRMSRRRAESVSPALLSTSTIVEENHHHPAAPSGRAQRGLGSLQLAPTFVTSHFPGEAPIERPTRPGSMMLSSNGLPVPATSAAGGGGAAKGGRFRPSNTRTTTSSSTATTASFDSPPPAQPLPQMLSPLSRTTRDLSPFPSPRQTPASTFSPSLAPSPALTSAAFRSPQLPSSPLPPASPLASPSTPKIRAKVTPMASPRRKPLLPGAPNPEAYPTEANVSNGKGLMGGLGLAQRLRAVASVPALRARAHASSGPIEEGWINGSSTPTASPNPSMTMAGLGIDSSTFDDVATMPAPTNVLVCVRVRPANHATSKALNAGGAVEDGSEAWDVDERDGALMEVGGLNPANGNDDWRFDAVRSGSENRGVYDVAAKDLVLYVKRPLSSSKCG